LGHKPGNALSVEGLQRKLGPLSFLGDVALDQVHCGDVHTNELEGFMGRWPTWLRFNDKPLDRYFELTVLWAIPPGAVVGAVLGFYASGLGAALLCVLLGALAGPVLVFALRGAIGF
jgi:hypothetical protein